MVNAIIDIGAQVTTMFESAVSCMPSVYDHRDAPPGTAVKYGNGEIKNIERLVDIGHYEVQITPDNCQASLISVNQLVHDEHTVALWYMHIPEDIMCYYTVQGDRPMWKNTNVTVKEIRQVFRLSPCLICVLVKKCKEGMAQWKPRKKYKRLRKGKELSDTKNRKPSTKEEMDAQDGRGILQAVQARGAIEIPGGIRRD